MAEMHFKDKDRIFFSLFIALLAHAAIFFMIQWMVKTRPDVPEYTGPLFVEITDRDTVVPDADKITEPLPEVEQEDPEEDPPPPLEPPPEPVLPPLDEEIVRDDPDAVPVFTVRPHTPPPVKTPVRTERTRTPDTKPPATPRVTMGSTPRSTPAATPRTTPRQTNTPVPEEESAFSDDILSNLDSALENPGTSGTSSPQSSNKPADRPGTEAGTTTGGTTSRITWDVANEEREIIARGTPDLSGISNIEFSQVKVELSFSVQPQGFIVDPRVIRSSGYTQVDTAAIEALKQYQFKPVTGSQPTEGTIVFTIRKQ